jgi:hypothetical protein
MQSGTPSKKVDFLICGAQKAGTTSLHAYLQRHPELYLPPSKEVHYFDSDDLFVDGSPNHELYHAHFKAGKPEQQWGEATPIYMYWKTAIARIFAYNPHIKIIIILRNPIERAYSHWNMEHRRGLENLSFYEAIKMEKERCRSSSGGQHRVYSYCDRGFYSKQISRIKQLFPEGNIMILKSENLREQPRHFLGRICEFLGVTPLTDASPIHLHVLPYPEPMDKKSRKYLHSIFADEIRLLEKMLDWDCSLWAKE